MSERIYTAKDEAVRLFFSQCRLSVEMSEQLIKEYKPMLMNRRFITDAQLSENLNISRRTLQDYRNEGRIAYIQLGGKILYRESDIERMLTDSYRTAYRQTAI